MRKKLWKRNIALAGNLPLPGFRSLELEGPIREALCQMAKAKKPVETPEKMIDRHWETLEDEETEAQAWLNLLITVSLMHHSLWGLSRLSPELAALCSSALRKTGELSFFVISEMGIPHIMNLFEQPMTLHYTCAGSLKVFSDKLENSVELDVTIGATPPPSPTGV